MELGASDLLTLFVHPLPLQLLVMYIPSAVPQSPPIARDDGRKLFVHGAAPTEDDARGYGVKLADVG